LIQIRRRRISSDLTRSRSADHQFELMLGAFREQHNELRAINEAALGKLRGISFALYIILGINIIILAGLAWLAWLAWLTLRDVPF